MPAEADKKIGRIAGTDLSSHPAARERLGAGFINEIFWALVQAIA